MTKEEEIDQFCRVAKVQTQFAPKTLTEAYIMGMEHGRYDLKIDLSNMVPICSMCREENKERFLKSSEFNHDQKTKED